MKKLTTHGVRPFADGTRATFDVTLDRATHDHIAQGKPYELYLKLLPVVPTETERPTMPGTDGIAKGVQKAAAGTIDVKVTHTVPVDVRAATALLSGFVDFLERQSILITNGGTPELWVESYLYQED